MKKAKQTSASADKALVKAAAKGDLKEVKNRIAAGAEVNAAAKNEELPLFAAIGSGKLAVVQTLLDAGANLDCIAYPQGSSLKKSPLYYAIEEGHWDIAQTLVKAGANIGLEPWKGENAVGEAANQASKEYYTLTASDEDWLGERRTKAVKEKARANCQRWMQFVRDAIADGVKVRDYWLWNAVNHCHDELALLLISVGVNPDAAPHGSSALVRSIEHGRDDVALALIRAGANVTLRARQSPLLVAAQKGRGNVIAALLKAGADVDAVGDITIGDFGEPEVKEDTDAKGRIIGRTTHVPNPPVAEAATALIVAARLGNEALVNLLLTLGADLNRADKHGLTALAWAQRGGKQSIVELLKKAGANEPEFAEGSLNTALWTAARQGDLPRVEMLLGRGAKPDDPVEDREGKHLPLVSAAREGRLEVVQSLLKHGATVNAVANENWSAGITPLMAAAREGHVTVVKALLNAGADLEVKDAGVEGGGETALHYAARGGHPKIIQALLAAGAKLNAKAKGGHTPLLVAVSETKPKAAKALLAAGADANAGPSDGSGPLYLAASEHQLELVKLLLEHGAQPLPRAKKASFLPLEAAASKGSVAIVQLLLKAGAPVNAQGVVGGTALSSALLFGHADVADVLLKAGADPNLAERDGFTPLMAATRSGNLAAVQFLIQAGANTNAIATDGRTAIKIARQERSKKIIAILEGEAKKQPAPETPARKPAPTKQKQGDEEEVAAPDFSKTSDSPKFQEMLHEVEKLCGTKADSLGDIKGGYSFAVSRADAEKLLADHHQRLLAKGAYFFRHHRDYQDAQDKLGLLPTSDWADLIRTFQTNGANYELMPEDIVRWLKKLSAQQPFIITGAGWDWLEGRFTSPVQSSRTVAHQLYEFCPDIVDQGVGSVKNLARSLEKDGYFFFWWD